LYDGKGSLIYSFDAVKNTRASSPGRDVVDVTPSSNGILITITATDPNKTGDYIRNIRVVYAPYESILAAGEFFNPDFINRTSHFRALRFMDWGATNSSTEGTAWSARATPDYAFWGPPKAGTRSVPVEVMVALSNKLGFDPWFNVPHMATDDYITQIATLVHQKLANDRKVYVEYSNETWNGAFAQTNWLANQGVALWPNSPSGWAANRSYYGMRTAQMCD